MGDPKDMFRKILEEGARELAPSEPLPDFVIERPKNPQHGDLSSNVAMQLAKRLKRNPFQIAELLVDFIRPGLAGHEVEIARPGFINLRLKPEAKLQAIRQAIEEGRNFGRARQTNGQKIQGEFVS